MIIRHFMKNANATIFMRQSSLKRLLYFMCFFLLLFFVNGVHALTDISKTVIMGPSTFNTSGILSSESLILPDLFTGTFNYTIPIEVPPGRNGIEPRLSLTYRSNSSNGWVGLGWEIEVGAIERSTRFGLNYGGGKFVYHTSGSNVDLISIGGGEYQAKIEGAFTKIKKLTASDGRPYWEMVEKSGIRYLFGQTSASRQDDPEDPNMIFKWCLDRVEDTNGNYMTFTYAKDRGQIYLDRIDYTGNGALSLTNYVKFYLEPRSDAPNMYTTNFRVKTIYRLRSIDIFTQDSLARRYKLEYNYSPSTSRSLLSKIIQYGGDGIQYLPPIILDYTTGGTDFRRDEPGPNVWVVNNDEGALIDISRVKFGDFNGDNKADIAIVNGWGSTQPMSIYFSTGDGFTGAIA
ncbi:MAG: SpvB/TcaC N-terminal domain-containing protein, partial [Thermodesulfovibrionales bacterium]